MCECDPKFTSYHEVEYNVGYPDSEENIIHCICENCGAEWVE